MVGKREIWSLMAIVLEMMLTSAEDCDLMRKLYPQISGYNEDVVAIESGAYLLKISAYAGKVNRGNCGFEMLETSPPFPIA